MTINAIQNILTVIDVHTDVDMDKGGIHMSITIDNSFFNYSGSLFSTTSSSSSSSSSSNILGDYAAIKNGSYYKLLKAYYANEESQETSSTAAADKVNVVTLREDAVTLKKAADALKTTGEDSLFNKKTVTSTDSTTGETTTTSDYDYDAIYDAAKSFIDAYNSMLESAGNVSTSIVEKKMNITTSFLRNNSDLLTDAGISIASDGKLSIDKTKFMESDMGTLKTIFNGTNSISDKLSKRASDMYSTAQKVLSSVTGTYTNKADLSSIINTGSLYDTSL